MVNLLPWGSYLEFSPSGRSTPSIDPELSTFLVSYHSKNLDISVGDFTAGLSHLTLGRSRGIKVETSLGEVSLDALVGSPRKWSKTSDEDCLYGLRAWINLTDNFSLAANYVQEKKSQNSIASLEAEFALSPAITLSGECAWSSYKEEEIESERKRRNAFRIGASAYLEKLTLDGSYERTGENFFSVANATLLNGEEEGDLCRDYSFTDYINGMLYYDQHDENVSKEGNSFRSSLADASLAFSLPKLPSLTVSYDINENFSNERSGALIDDTTNTFTVGISYPVKSVRFSVSHSRSDYKDRTEFPSRETTMSNSYGISTPWARYLVLSANYGTSDTRDLIALNATKDRCVTLGMAYKVIPDKLIFSNQYKAARKKDSENTVDNGKTTTSLTLSYYPTKKDVVQLGYFWTDEDNFVSTSAPTLDRKNLYLTSRCSVTKNQSLELRYALTSGREPTVGTSGSQNQSVHFSCNYRFWRR